MGALEYGAKLRMRSRRACKSWFRCHRAEAIFHLATSTVSRSSRCLRCRGRWWRWTERASRACPGKLSRPPRRGQFRRRKLRAFRAAAARALSWPDRTTRIPVGRCPSARRRFVDQRRLPAPVAAASPHRCTESGASTVTRLFPGHGTGYSSTRGPIANGRQSRGWVRFCTQQCVLRQAGHPVPDGRFPSARAGG